MKNAFYLCLGLVGAWATTGSASAAPPGPPPPRAPPVAGPSVTRDATVKAVLRTPRGDVDAVILDDGTIVRVPPHVLRTTAPAIGARVHAEGALVGPLLRPDSLKIAGAAISLAPPGEPPPPPDRESQLQTIDESATIAIVVRNPDGMPEALLLSDGASVVVGPPMAAAGPSLRTGARVHARGEGGRYAGQAALHARTLEVNGATYTDAPPEAGRPTPPPGPPVPPPPPPQR